MHYSNIAWLSGARGLRLRSRMKTLALSETWFHRQTVPNFIRTKSFHLLRTSSCFGDTPARRSLFIITDVAMINYRAMLSTIKVTYLTYVMLRRSDTSRANFKVNTSSLDAYERKVNWVRVSSGHVRYEIDELAIISLRHEFRRQNVGSDPFIGWH